jgi:predicted PurR-regulated permease PerM
MEEIWIIFLRVQLLIFILLVGLMGVGVLLIIWLFRSGLLTFSPLALILLLILVFAGAQQVDNLWLRPQLMGQKLHLHPGIVFVGLTGALIVSGVLGALLVVPLIASAKVLGRYINAKLLDEPPWDDVPDDNNLVSEQQNLETRKE